MCSSGRRGRLVLEGLDGSSAKNNIGSSRGHLGVGKGDEGSDNNAEWLPSLQLEDAMPLRSL